jgi:imidazolonepropionase-like amidohydrolase
MALLIIVFQLSSGFAQTDSVPKPFAITNANVLNVVTGKVDADQTIIVENRRISSVGSSKKIKVPAGYNVVNGANKFVMPGMTDAHIHFFQSGGLYTRPDGLNLNAVYSYEKDQKYIKDNLSDLMKRYLAAGITTVIDVGGPLNNYAIRDKLNKLDSAPTAWVTGPLISTYEPPNLDKKDPPIVKVTTEEAARELVRKQLPYKPDFIKIWYIVLPGQSAKSNLPIVKATIEESHANGLKVAVHATEYETAKLAVNAGADILVHSVDDRELDQEMLQLLKTKQTVYIPTLIVAQNYNRTFTQNFNFNAHDFRVADPFMLGTLMDLQHIERAKMPFDYKKVGARFKVPAVEDTVMAKNLKLVQTNSGLVVSGTDAGNIGTHHASSLFAELIAMKASGLSNWEVLRSTTINAAKGFGKEKEYGSVEKGKIADLLILEKNPADDLNALENIETVIHRGSIMKASELLPVTPAILAQQQLNAYNARDIDAFLAPYAEDVELYDFPDKLISKGKEAMRKTYEGMFKTLKELHCEVTQRIIQGNSVIDHESVTGFGGPVVKAVAVYQIENNKIKKVYFIE